MTQPGLSRSHHDVTAGTRNMMQIRSPAAAGADGHGHCGESESVDVSLTQLSEPA